MMGFQRTKKGCCVVGGAVKKRKEVGKFFMDDAVPSNAKFPPRDGRNELGEERLSDSVH